jgi:hypothetical protein
MNYFLVLLVTWGMSMATPSGEKAPLPELTKGSPPIVLDLKPPMDGGSSIKLGYVIPYPGYIEFHLFDDKDQKIWVDYGVREKGEHYQSLKKEKLTPGLNYRYEFWYKGKPYSAKFSI